MPPIATAAIAAGSGRAVTLSTESLPLRASANRSDGLASTNATLPIAFAPATPSMSV